MMFFNNFYTGCNNKCKLSRSLTNAKTRYYLVGRIDLLIVLVLSKKKAYLLPHELHVRKWPSSICYHSLQTWNNHCSYFFYVMNHDRYYSETCIISCWILLSVCILLTFCSVIQTLQPTTIRDGILHDQLSHRLSHVPLVGVGPLWCSLRIWFEE